MRPWSAPAPRLRRGRLSQGQAFDGQQVVGATVEDGGGDLGLAPHGVDSDQGAFQFEALEQQRDCGDLVGFDVRSFLAEDETLA